MNGRILVLAIALPPMILLSRASAFSESAVTLTNKLATASSPYLREAATQPVAWYPWGAEPFRLAKALNRPILLDLGAIWCHWCHVMDQETYSNPEVARLVNAHYIAIKVDRDERPDIDVRYQRAVQALTGHGGWPLTVFLTPEGKVFYGGGTFLPEDGFGQPGFKTLLPKIAEAYHAQNAEVSALAEKVQAAVAALEAATLRSGDLSPRLVEAAAEALVQSFDGEHGGFGQGAKFPMPSPLELALRLYAERADPGMLRIVTKTLDEIAAGGIHDQVGGGFHRYATDPAWQIPHFEILDYVNAQLLMAYLGAYQATGKMRYREVAEGIIAYVNRMLSDGERGGFYAHQDADMRAGDDGGYYTWDLSEVEAALPREEAAVIIRYYGVRDRGNMPGGGGQNILRVVATPEAVAHDLSLPLSKATALIASGNAHLLEARNKRPAPFVDRTLFADRNGMMITAYLEGFKVLGRDELKAIALKSLESLLARLRSKDGRLFHGFADGRPHVRGLLSDYVWVAQACLQAFQLTGESRYLTTAQGLMDMALGTLWDSSGGFFDLRPWPAALGLLQRPLKSFEDMDVPSPNAMAARVLDQLTYLTNAPRYQQKAGQLLRAFAGRAPEAGRFAAGYALAVDLHLHPPAHAVIIGSHSDPRTGALWQAALAAFRPGKIVAAYDPARVKPTELPPPVASALRNTQAAGSPQAYVCVGPQCSLPTSEPAKVTVLVTTFQRQAPEGGGSQR